MKVSSTWYLIACWVVLGLAGCTTSQEVTQEPILQSLVEHSDQSIVWQDDLVWQDLAPAVEQSLRYYRRLPDSRTFDYGGTSYTAREVEASLRLFLETVQTYEGPALQQELQKKFRFLESKNDTGSAFFTGYYEPMLEGDLQPSKEYPVPLYAMPDDLIRVDLGLFKEEFKGKRILGRVKGKRFVPYDSRNEIAYENSLKDRAKPLAYVRNDVDLFFLQIQGSGLLRLPNGDLKRVNYAGQNGHPYRAIGRLLIQENKISRAKMSMQAIKTYLKEHPDEVPDILNYNPSYTFFRSVEEGPLGYIEVPLTPHRSIAMDRKLIPRGALAFIETEEPVFDHDHVIDYQPVHRFVLVQDTGGAIRGHGRADLFWGHGKEAELKAGHMKQRGRIFLIIARKEFLK